jgi:hypothetical protein
LFLNIAVTLNALASFFLVRECVSCCDANDEIAESEPCFDCQCEITPADIESQIGFLPEDNVLGTIEDSDIVVDIDEDGTIYVEYNTTIVGHCHEW